MKMILTPIDFSDATSRVVDEAADLAEAFDGYVMLLHVVRKPEVATDFVMEVADVAELMVEIERAADEQLAEVKDGLQQRGVAAQSLRLNGYPPVAIVDQARKLSVDYIVMGSHGHTAFYDLVIGSTTSAVVKRAACPVIIVPALKKGVVVARRADAPSALAATS